jgi:Calponin homology (CH) domain
MRDGLALARLIEVLFDRKITTKVPSSLFDFNYNANVSLEALKQAGAPTGGLSASDLVDNKQSISLFNLVWGVFFFFIGAAEGNLPFTHPLKINFWQRWKSKTNLHCGVRIH